MKYALEIKNLTKSYQKHNVVDQLSFCVPEGKIYGFLGKNGAGKTTTIRMIMGLIKPDQGNILVFGKDSREDRLWAARNIGAIVETPGFYENLTARENLEITTELYGVGRERITDVLEIVELADVGNKKAGNFSLGMKQRLGIANSLVHWPKILIPDEPTNGLDPAGIRDMRKFLRNLSEKEGITVMISSHILSEVQLIADYVGIIDQGHLVEETDIQSLKEGEQSCLLLEVDDPEQAEQVLMNMKLPYQQEVDGIRIYCCRQNNCEINRSLVLKGIKVFNLSSISQSLEERFLSITGGKIA